MGLNEGSELYKERKIRGKNLEKIENSWKKAGKRKKGKIKIKNYY